MLTLVADDLTGACDTGGLFAAAGSVPVTVWPQPPSPAPVCVVDTESRVLGAREAAARVAGTVVDAASSRFFKKIDSTLRGNVGSEVDALMRSTNSSSAVLAPAFPAQGRVVIDRTLLVHGIPLAETPLGRDPELPRAGTSNVCDLLRDQIDRPLAWIPIDQVRAGVDALSGRLGRLAGTVAVADAETDEDLGDLVEAALAVQPSPLLVGAAGLARALAARFGLLADRVDLPAGTRWLVVAGSRHPATRAQVAMARAAGMRVLASATAESPDRARVAARLAAEARRLLAREPIDVAIVTGGQTLAALYRAFDAERIDLLGAPAPGLALGRLRSPRRPALTILTKAGAFGPPDLLVSLWKEAVA